MNGIPMEHGLILASILFALGLVGLMMRRNMLFVLMSLEIMMNSAGLAFIVAGTRWGQPDGQVMFLLVITLATGQGFLPATMTGVAALLALGLVSHTFGQGLLAVALGSLSAAFSSLVIFIEALAAAILGWLVLSEHLTPLQFLGGALILAGVWVARPKN